MKLNIGYLYPSLMSQYGDRGNLLCLLQRCLWRGIEAEVIDLEIGDPVDPCLIDLFLMGGGADMQERMVADDLVKVKGEGIHAAIEEGAAALVICAGYQLWGHYYRTYTGETLTGLSVFDATTTHRAYQIGARLTNITEAGSVRSVDNLVVEWEKGTLVGFENHGGRTYLGAGAKPLGRVVLGGGNNSEDGSEGCVYKNAIGTYLHGPALPKNPALADHLIAAALRRKYEAVELEPLADDLEAEAHAAALQRALRLAGRVGSDSLSARLKRTLSGKLASLLDA